VLSCNGRSELFARSHSEMGVVVPHECILSEKAAEQIYVSTYDLYRFFWIHIVIKGGPRGFREKTSK
jgi:hypothetical protein